MWNMTEYPETGRSAQASNIIDNNHKIIIKPLKIKKITQKRFEMTKNLEKGNGNIMNTVKVVNNIR